MATAQDPSAPAPAMAADPAPAKPAPTGISNDPSADFPNATTQPSALPTDPVPAPAPAPAPAPTSANQTTSAAPASEPTQPSDAAVPPPYTSTDPAVAAKDTTNPTDFQGEVLTNNDLPSLETLRKIESYTVLGRDGRSVPFKSLFTGHNVARRVLVIFVRHFFCGMCQEYLRKLAKSITPDALLQLPVPTFIAVVGCGAPELIDGYVAETGCQFPVYADPTRRLYSELGMVRTLSKGSRPAYMQGRSFASTVVSGVVQGLRHVRDGLVTKMGDQRQVGGEFLFEPADASLDHPADFSAPGSDTGADDEASASASAAAPAASSDPEKVLFPSDKPETTTAGSSSSAKTGDKRRSQERQLEEKRITWCHRMRSTRDHAEIPELMEVLGLEPDGVTPTARGHDKRWAKALATRKGTGLSMASQMSRMSAMPDGASAVASVTEAEEQGRRTTTAEAAGSVVCSGRKR